MGGGLTKLEADKPAMSKPYVISRVLNHDAETCFLQLFLRIYWNPFHSHQKSHFSNWNNSPSDYFLEKFSRCDLGLANLYDVAAEFLSSWRCWNCYYTSGLGGFEVLFIRTSHYIARLESFEFGGS